MKNMIYFIAVMILFQQCSYYSPLNTKTNHKRYNKIPWLSKYVYMEEESVYHLTNLQVNKDTITATRVTPDENHLSLIHKITSEGKMLSGNKYEILNMVKIESQEYVVTGNTIQIPVKSITKVITYEPDGGKTALAGLASSFGIVFFMIMLAAAAA